MGGTSFTVEALISLPRLSGLALSNEGARLVASAARPDAEGKKLVSALYEFDVDGKGAPRRLTRSAPGESGAVFAPDGSLLFTSERPDPDAKPDGPRGETTALWLLPAGGGESRLVAGPPGGVEAVAVARESGSVVFAAGTYPGTENWEEDAEREKARKDAEVSAQLFEEYPIRFWDHYLGPRERHLQLIPAPEGENRAASSRDLIPTPGRSLELAGFDVTPDGSTVVTGRWSDTDDVLERDLNLVAIDVDSGKQRTLAGDRAWYESPACSPDGRYAVAVRDGRSTPEEMSDNTLYLFDLTTGEGKDLLAGFDRWPQGPAWSHDSGTVFFTADDDGHVPIFGVELAGGAVRRLTGEGAFSDLCPAPDGLTLYALRSGIAKPPHPVAIDLRDPDSEPRRLGNFPELELDLPSRTERISVEVQDGTRIPSWLVLPRDASPENPAPLAVFIHGGPIGSWNTWHWRWNPHVFVEGGWAVLLPDPALSIGYGIEALRRGWGRWGDVVYDDLMRAVDGAEGHEDIDASKTIAMGGSFGGYMANWIAGHTDRFRAIVTHASLWNLEGFHGDTDLGAWWEQEFGDPYEDLELYRKNSPHLHIRNIDTPMLVIHGELDYRVPIGEALTLWTDLKRNGVEARFLYFPDENHFILKPNNSRIWYETVQSFIDQHALGRQWTRPDLL
jgi:dipeptidyl aminopeptidase/acylaminoacyl peptidase